MEDSFHLFELNKRLVKLIHESTNIASVSENYIIEPTSKNGEKIIENIKVLEENLEKVKQSLVRMVDSIESDSETIAFEETKDGFKLE